MSRVARKEISSQINTLDEENARLQRAAGRDGGNAFAMLTTKVVPTPFHALANIAAFATARSMLERYEQETNDNEKEPRDDMTDAELLKCMQYKAIATYLLRTMMLYATA